MDEVSARRAPTPRVFHLDSPERQAIVEELRKRLKFFHWEIEFPDVFTPDRSGFDAVQGNPPWEVMKPNSHEFFTEYDPIYRTYDKQTALRRQQELFELDAAIRDRWIEFNALFKAYSNWVKNAHAPFDLSLARGNRGAELLRSWQKERQKRVGFADPQNPYRHQGSADLNSYKMFLEVGHHLLHSRGRLGMIVPSGLYTDSGSTALRELFMERCTWDWLFSFENRKKIFDIDGRFKFAPTIVDRHKNGVPMKAAFMVHDLREWEKDDPPVFKLDRSLIPLFSPRSRSIPEVRTARDLAICRTIYDHSIRIGDQAPGWEIEYAREFDMTNDSKHFKPRE
ncbi:MAG: Eco57I restriction-modification methylase domain-containing protein [bacterium]